VRPVPGAEVAEDMFGVAQAAPTDCTLSSSSRAGLRGDGVRVTTERSGELVAGTGDDEAEARRIVADALNEEGWRGLEY